MSDEVTIGEVNRNVQAMAADVQELTGYVRAQNGRVGALERQVAVLEAVVPATGGSSSKTHIAAGGAAGATLAMIVEFIWKKLVGG